MQFSPKRTPIHYDLRRTKQFAWLPVQTDSQTTVWLERYYKTEQFDGEKWIFVQYSYIPKRNRKSIG